MSFGSSGVKHTVATGHVSFQGSHKGEDRGMCRILHSCPDEDRNDVLKGRMGSESEGNQLQVLFFGAFFHSSSSILMASGG